MSKKGTKFVAKYQGKIVGTRTSPRPYTFAIVTQSDIEASRKAVYEYQADKSDQANFDYFAQVAACTTETPIKHPAGFTYYHSAADIARAQEHVAGGFEGYVARRQARLIAEFERRAANGAFEPQVAAWSMSRHNAEKSARAFADRVLAIVPAEAA